MRKKGNGWIALPTGSYTLGQNVGNTVDSEHGTVVSMGSNTFTILWLGSNSTVTYPVGTPMVRRIIPVGDK